MTPTQPSFSVQLRRASGMLVLLSALTIFAFYFTERYRIAFNGAASECLRASVFLIDSWDKSVATGQLVAFKMTKDIPIAGKGATWVKKVVAMPGQTVQVGHESVSVGSVRYPLQTSYVLSKLGMKFEDVKPEWQLSQNQIFLLGETLTSFDSRFWGPIESEEIVGKAYAIF